VTNSKEERYIPICSKLRFFYLLSAGFLLLMGIAIYVMFRSSDLLVWKVFAKPAFWNKYAIATSIENGNFLSILVYHGPDGLWLLSGIFLLRAIWLMQTKICMAYIGALCLIGILFEIGQYYKIVHGTFDFFDILTYLSVALVECIFFKLFIERRIFYDEKKSKTFGSCFVTHRFCLTWSGKRRR
jgi:hypothetical protein